MTESKTRSEGWPAHRVTGVDVWPYRQADSGAEFLLLHRSGRDGAPFWQGVSGWIEAGEAPHLAALRELREETGLEIEPLEFLGVWMDRYGGDSTAEATLNLYWTARVVSGEPEPADDVDALQWFSADELPGPDGLAFENVPLVLSAWAGQQHP